MARKRYSAQICLAAAGRCHGYGYTSLDDSWNAIRQFSGEETSSQSRLATESSNRQFANLGARMDAIRRGARTTISPVAFNFHGVDLGEALAGDLPPLAGGTGAGDERDADTGWAWFSNGAVGWGDRDETDNEGGYDFDSWGITLGADYAFDNGLAVGLALGYSSYDVDLDRTTGSSFISSSAGGKIESEGYSLSGFFVYGMENSYVNGILSYGRNDFDMARKVQLTAAPGATGTAQGLVLDRRFDASTDSNQLGAQDTQSVQSIVGVMVRHASSTGFGVLLPYAGVEWRHEFDNEAQTLDYSYAFALPGSGVQFRSPTDDPDEDFFELTLGLSAQFANNLFAFVQYNNTAGLSRTSANLIPFGLRGVF